jgi:catechol 2,3-dioxygenase-like lactoylglutathione lyase family enzyme
MKAAKTLEGFKQLTLFWFDVSDLHRSVQFYRDTVRLKLVFLDEQAGWASFDTGAPGVELGLAVRPLGGTPGRGGGACPVFEVEDILQTREALEARGVVFDGGIVGEAGTRRHCTFRDPDGNALQISQVWS